MHQSTTRPPVQLQLPGNPSVRFDLDPVTSDAGVPLIGLIDQRIGLTKRLAPLVPDKRNPDFVTHTNHDLLRQRVYGIIAGYEDANDAAHMRGDPAFKLACGRAVSDPKTDLASQPTLSRFEARATRKSLYHMRVALFEDWLERRETPKGRSSSTSIPPGTPPTVPSNSPSSTATTTATATIPSWSTTSRPGSRSWPCSGPDPRAPPSA